MKLIDKSAVVAEIERRWKYDQGFATEEETKAYQRCCDDILYFIDSLEIKEVDLEKRRSFNEGVWYAVQHLVLTEDEPTLAKGLLKTMNVEQKEWLDIQYGTSYKDDKMVKFLKSI